MDALKLVKMANDIATFFAAEPDRVAAAASVAQHMERFWDPRMRGALHAWVEQQGGAGLDPLALEAVRSRRAGTAPR